MGSGWRIFDGVCEVVQQCLWFFIRRKCKGYVKVRANAPLHHYLFKTVLRVVSEKDTISAGMGTGHGGAVKVGIMFKE
jgi:hypothetical protein